MLSLDEPHAMSFDEWDDWEEKKKREQPVAWFVRRTVPRFFSRKWREWIHEPWYWLKCRVWHRWNVIHIRTLPPTWMDRDDTLLHAAFQIFTDFVEFEEPAEFRYSREEYGGFWDGCEARLKGYDEMHALYNWWKVERPARKEPEEGDGVDWGKELLAADRRWDDEDNAMLKRLVDIRKSLWT